MMRWKKKPNKYHNRKVTVGGVTYDSVKEAERHAYLSLLEQQGVIQDLKRQVKHELIPAVKKDEIIHLKTKDKVVTRTLQLPITYTSDFEYTIVETGENVVEDVKASPKLLPKDFQLKAKIFFWKYGTKVKLIYKANQSIYGN